MWSMTFTVSTIQASEKAKVSQRLSTSSSKWLTVFNPSLISPPSFHYLGSRECVVCMSEPRTTTVLPCRHLCVCAPCAELMRVQTNKCPICRAPVTSLLSIPALPFSLSNQFGRCSFFIFQKALLLTLDITLSKDASLKDSRDIKDTAPKDKQQAIQIEEEEEEDEHLLARREKEKLQEDSQVDIDLEDHAQ